MRFERKKFALPYATLYFDSERGLQAISWGSAKTLQTAKRATFTKMGAFELYSRAFIYDRRTNKVLWRGRRTANGSVMVVNEVIENTVKRLGHKHG
jgi:hypothetical protein